MAPTRPSIMSEGATTSAPARAWETAVRARSSRVGSFLTSSPSTTPQWPWEVYSQRQTSVITSRSRHSARMARDGLLHDAVVGVGLAPQWVLLPGKAEQDHAADAQRLDLPRLAGGLVGREVEAAGEGGDLATHAPCPT